MAVFSPVGWMLKGGGSKPVTATNMDESDFGGSSDGLVWTVIKSAVLKISSLTISMSGISFSKDTYQNFLKDPDRNRVKVYFKIEQIGGGWSNYYNTNRTVDFTKTSQKISFKRSDMSPKVLESVESHNYTMYLAFKTETNVYKNLDAYNVDFKVTKSK